MLIHNYKLVHRLTETAQWSYNPCNVGLCPTGCIFFLFFLIVIFFCHYYYSANSALLSVLRLVDWLFSA